MIKSTNEIDPKTKNSRKNQKVKNFTLLSLPTEQRSRGRWFPYNSFFRRVSSAQGMLALWAYNSKEDYYLVTKTIWKQDNWREEKRVLPGYEEEEADEEKLHSGTETVAPWATEVKPWIPIQEKVRTKKKMQTFTDELNCYWNW